MNTTVASTGRAVDHVTRELTDTELHQVTATLATHGLRVEPVLDVLGVVHLWAQHPTTTLQEVRVLAAFTAVTDARIAWHPKEATR